MSVVKPAPAPAEAIAESTDKLPIGTRTERRVSVSQTKLHVLR